jgi:hypothetical protein
MLVLRRGLPGGPNWLASIDERPSGRPFVNARIALGPTGRPQLVGAH